MKISVVMQSYLYDYPGSRIEPEKKFIRAVKSFLKQTYDNKELVIIADGCSITSDLFYSKFYKNKEIKFMYLHKSQKQSNMYAVTDNKKFYRGLPTKLGCSFATGDLITYMDSDDIILPTRLEDIKNAWEGKYDQYDWSNNTTRYVHINHNKDYDAEYQPIINKKIKTFKKYGVGGEYVLKGMIKDNWLLSPPAITHKKNIKITWEDTIGVKEDFRFGINLLNKCIGFKQESPTYVICHSADSGGHWDE